MGNEIIIVPDCSDLQNYCWVNDLFTAPPCTPTFLTVEVTYVRQGDLWQPEDPPPPNGTYVLSQTSDIEWSDLTSSFVMAVGFWSYESRFVFLLFSPIFETLFNNTVSVCKNVCFSQYPSPVGRYYFSGMMKLIGVE
jgi:hypothetical protein